MNVEPKMAMLCLGDINGRLTKLEPHIITDYNGDMRRSRSKVGRAANI